MSTYPEDHPLHGRDANHIGDMAKSAMRAIDERTPTMSAVYSTANLLALVHEHRSLKAEAEGEKADREEWRNMVHGCAVAMGMRLGDDASEFVEFARKLREERDNLNEVGNRCLAPYDWLDHAIDRSRAPDGSDWAGLLEHIDTCQRKAVYDRAIAESQIARVEELKSELETESRRVDELNRNAESAACKLREFNKREETRHQERMEASDARHAEQLAAVSKLRERAESAESKASLFEQDLDAASCRADTEAGRANRLLERCRTSEAKVAELEVRANSNARQVAGVVDYLGGSKTVGQAGNLAKMVDERIAELKVRITELDAQAKLSAQHPGLLAKYVELGNLADLTAVIGSHADMVEADLKRRESDQPPLDRIAADVKNIAAAMERMVPSA